MITTLHKYIVRCIVNTTLLVHITLPNASHAIQSNATSPEEFERLLKKIYKISKPLSQQECHNNPKTKSIDMLIQHLYFIMAYDERDCNTMKFFIKYYFEPCAPLYFTTHSCLDLKAQLSIIVHPDLERLDFWDIHKDLYILHCKPDLKSMPFFKDCNFKTEEQKRIEKSCRTIQNHIKASADDIECLQVPTEAFEQCK